MGRIARYGRSVARPGHGAELAKILLGAAADLAGNPGCELYLVSHEKDKPDVIWVTELWRSQADLDEVLAQLRGSEGVTRAMSLVESWEMIELGLLGGKGPPQAPA